MNSRQRVTAAIARESVDQVPLGFYAVDYDVVEKVIGRKTYVRNKVDTQIAYWEGRRDEVVESLKKDTVEFYQKIDCADIILPKEAPLVPPKDYDPDPPKLIAEDEWECADGKILKASRQSNEIQCVYDPNPIKQYSVEDFQEEIEVVVPDESVFEALDYVIEKLGDDRYVAGTTAGLSMLTLLGGMENGLMLYALQPEVVKAATVQETRYLNSLDKYYVHEGVPGVLMENDLAGTNGPFVSPGMFKEINFPYVKQRIESAKQFTPQVIVHNCGNNIPVMDILIETGFDCYQSLQTTAGMEIGKLKKMFGDRMSFWGGVAVEMLIGGTPDDVRKEVRVAMERGAPGGGFILGPSHSVAHNTSYENFMAMLDEFVKLRDKF